MTRQRIVAAVAELMARQEIASAVLFLTTDTASFVHGAVLRVDGGRVAV